MDTRTSHVVDTLINQRNEALNRIADMSGEIGYLQQYIMDLEAKLLAIPSVSMQTDSLLDTANVAQKLEPLY